MAVAVLAAACSSAPSPTPSVVDQRRDEPRLIRIATLDEPVALAVRSGDPALYVAEKGGRVVAIRDGNVDPVPVLDLSSEVSHGAEQGLLGIAFSPDGRFIYANYTDARGDTNLVEAAMDDRTADPSSLRLVLHVHQPYSNHNGGNLVFGPDGYLYMGLGDGGSAGDPQGNAQSPSTLLGKMLRIDPRPSGGEPYGIPPDNPFVHRPDARPEIWAYGLRNPGATPSTEPPGTCGSATSGSPVGRDRHATRGIGGRGELRMERPGRGLIRYGPTDAPPGAVDPVVEYDHGGGGCGIIGGYVYRGEAIPALVGAYVYSDLCLGRLEALRLRSGQVRRIDLGLSVQAVSSFGEDADGELYVLSLAGGVYRLG